MAKTRGVIINSKNIGPILKAAIDKLNERHKFHDPYKPLCLRCGNPFTIEPGKFRCESCGYCIGCD